MDDLLDAFDRERLALDFGKDSSSISPCQVSLHTKSGVIELRMMGQGLEQETKHWFVGMLIDRMAEDETPSC